MLVSLRRFFRDEAGTSTIEFLFTFPIVVIVFCASFESSFFMIRGVSLERSVDIVVRDLRLGSLGAIRHWDLKREICETGALLGNDDECQRALQIELLEVDTVNFVMPNIPVVCRDVSTPIDPAIDPPESEFTLGDSNQIMLMRVCLKVDPFFKSSLFMGTMFGTRLRNAVAPDGGLSLVTTTTFVNEPRS